MTVAIDSERENSATAKSREHLDEEKTIWNRGFSPVNHLSSHHSRNVSSTCSVFLRWAQLLFPKKLVKLLSTWKPIFSSEKLVSILYNIFSGQNLLFSAPLLNHLFLIIFHLVAIPCFILSTHPICVYPSFIRNWILYLQLQQAHRRFKLIKMNALARQTKAWNYTTWRSHSSFGGLSKQKISSIARFFLKK